MRQAVVDSWQKSDMMEGMKKSQQVGWKGNERDNCRQKKPCRGCTREERVWLRCRPPCTWPLQPPSPLNVSHLKQETDSTALLGALLLPFTTPQLEKFFLWFNFNPPHGHLHFPSCTQQWGDKEVILNSRLHKVILEWKLLEGICETLTFYFLLLKIRKQKGKVMLLVCGWTGSFYHHPLCHLNPLLTTSPHPAAPSTPTSPKDKSFTSHLWEQSASFPKWVVYFRTKESLFLKGGIDLADHHWHSIDNLQFSMLISKSIILCTWVHTHLRICSRPPFDLWHDQKLSWFLSSSLLEQLQAQHFMASMHILTYGSKAVLQPGCLGCKCLSFGFYPLL